jgi:hypothetical protein
MFAVSSWGEDATKAADEVSYGANQEWLQKLDVKSCGISSLRDRVSGSYNHPEWGGRRLSLPPESHSGTQPRLDYRYCLRQ